jgi:hypothetical protein
MPIARIVLVPLIAILLAPVPGHANDSAYTDLDTDRCERLSPDNAEGGFILLKCRGWEDHPVYLKEGDLRQSVLYGHPGPAYIDGAFESFGPFNTAGDRIEWRLGPGGKPIAAILRWFIFNADPATGETSPAFRGQVLVVSKVADKEKEGCVAGYVDALANPQPNLIARRIADTQAGDFRCGTDRPAYHGTKGPLATDPTRSLPQ